MLHRPGLSAATAYRSLLTAHLFQTARANVLAGLELPLLGGLSGSTLKGGYPHPITRRCERREPIGLVGKVNRDFTPLPQRPGRHASRWPRRADAAYSRTDGPCRALVARSRQPASQHSYPPGVVFMSHKNLVTGRSCGDEASEIYPPYPLRLCVHGASRDCGPAWAHAGHAYSRSAQQGRLPGWCRCWPAVDPAALAESGYQLQAVKSAARGQHIGRAGFGLSTFGLRQLRALRQPHG